MADVSSPMIATPKDMAEGQEQLKSEQQGNVAPSNGDAPMDTTNIEPKRKRSDDALVDAAELKRQKSGDDGDEPQTDLKAETAGMNIEQDARPSTTTEKPPIPDIEGKTEAEVQDLLHAAAKQIYFYFSDSNLPLDRYLFSLTACNKDGWVPLKTIITFSRMAPFKSHGVQFVSTALRRAILDEGHDPLVAVSEDGENVKRERSLEPKKDAWDRSVYVKGFGEGDSETNSQRKLEAYFEQFGKINAVRMRRGNDDAKGPSGFKRGAFRGSVFAEFASSQEMSAFLKRDNIPKFLPDGPEMLFMSKDAYHSAKVKEKFGSEDNIKSGRHRGVTPSDAGSSSGPGKLGQKHKFNAFREMEKLKKGGVPDLALIPDSVAVVGKPLNTIPANDWKNGKKMPWSGVSEDGKPHSESSQPMKITYKGTELECDPETGVVLHRDQVPFDEDCVFRFDVTDPKDGSWQDLKAQVISHGIEKPFVSCPPNCVSGHIAKADSTRFSDEELRSLQDASIQFGGVTVEWSRPDRANQQAFWAKRADFVGGSAVKVLQRKNDSREQQHGGRDRMAGNGHGGHQKFGNKRGGGQGNKQGGRQGDRRGGKQDGRGGRRGERTAAKPATTNGLPPSVGTDPKEA